MESMPAPLGHEGETPDGRGDEEKEFRAGSLAVLAHCLHLSVASRGAACAVSRLYGLGRMRRKAASRPATAAHCPAALLRGGKAGTMLLV